MVRYISDTGQYRCTVSSLPLFYIVNIYINIYTHKISIYHKTLPQKSVYHKTLPQKSVFHKTLIQLFIAYKEKKIHNVKKKKLNYSSDKQN